MLIIFSVWYDSKMKIVRFWPVGQVKQCERTLASSVAILWNTINQVNWYWAFTELRCWMSPVKLLLKSTKWRQAWSNTQFSLAPHSCFNSPSGPSRQTQAVRCEQTYRWKEAQCLVPCLLYTLQKQIRFSTESKLRCRILNHIDLCRMLRALNGSRQQQVIARICGMNTFNYCRTESLVNEVQSCIGRTRGEGGRHYVPWQMCGVSSSF